MYTYTNPTYFTLIEMSIIYIINTEVQGDPAM